MLTKMIKILVNQWSVGYSALWNYSKTILNSASTCGSEESRLISNQLYSYICHAKITAMTVANLLKWIAHQHSKKITSETHTNLKRSRCTSVIYCIYVKCFTIHHQHTKNERLLKISLILIKITIYNLNYPTFQVWDNPIPFYNWCLDVLVL